MQRQSSQVRSVWAALTFLVIELRRLGHASNGGEICLIEAEPDAFFPQPFTDIQQNDPYTS